MGTAAFDTLKLSRRLEEAGFSREQSAGMAEALNDTLGGELVTRDYLDARLARVEADIRAVEHRLTIKLGAMMVVAVGVVAMLVRLLSAGAQP